MIFVDDYHPKNIELAKLIKSYGLEKDTWFAIDLRYDESIPQIEKLNEMGFNLASHTVNHAFLSEIQIEMAELEMESSKNILENLINKKIDWIVWPRGRYNNEVIKIARKIGYKYGRTTKLTDGKTNFEKGGLHLSYPRKEYNGTDPFTLVTEYSHFWGHTKEFLEYNLLDKFEEFLKWYKKIDEKNT